jgi:hypothetical protein
MGMLRPGSWSRPAGVSPVRVDTGVRGSRLRFAEEIWRAERGVESLCGASKHAGRSVKRILQPSQSHNGGAEPLMSRRRPCLAGPVPGSACRGRESHMRIVWAGTGETRLRSLRQAKTRTHKPMVKSPGVQRESGEGLVVPQFGVQHSAPGGKALTLITPVMRVRVRAWPGPPGSTSPAGQRLPYCWTVSRRSGRRPSGTHDDFSVGYGRGQAV